MFTSCGPVRCCRKARGRPSATIPRRSSPAGYTPAGTPKGLSLFVCRGTAPGLFCDSPRLGAWLRQLPSSINSDVLRADCSPEWHRAVAPGVEVGEITTHGRALSRLKHGFEGYRIASRRTALHGTQLEPSCL